MNNEISKSRTFQSVTASLAAAIIPDTPIVSIAGATLSEITTTTTSTTTTPTPTPTSFEPTKAPSTQTPINLGFTKDPMSNIPNDDAKDNISQNEHQLKQQLQEEEVKAEESVAAADMNNDSKTVIQINTTHKTCVTINSDDHKYCVDDDECAAKNENNNNNTNNAHGYKSQPNDMQNASLAPFVEGSNYKTLCAINSNGKLDTQTVAISIENETVATSGKNDEIKTNTKCKSLKQIENNNSNGNNKVDISDLGDKDLKNLLDEAYFYKPSDLENRSLVFQQLLKETEEEKEEKTRALKSGKLMQQLMKESGHIKEERIVKPGSLQNFVSEFRNEERKLHNCDFKSSKSVTVDSDGVMSVVVYPKTYMGACYRPTPQIVPRKNKLPTKNTDNSKSIEEEEDNLSKMPEKSDTSAKTTNAAVSGVNLKGRSGDFIIDMSDTMLDIQQKQQILQSKGQDPTTQGLPFYERMDSMELRIPRPNMKNAINLESKCSDGTNHCYVDDKVHFSSIERSGNYSAGLDTKYMPLDDNYKSYKSCLGEKGTTGAGAGTNMSLSKNTQHQYDENDNPVQKSYVVNYKLSSESSGAILSGTSGLSNSSSSNNNNNNSNITISSANSIGIPQTKTKSKKKSQQERNTKTVNVTSVAGYRGNDPVDDLVKYIENIDDKQTSSSKGGGNNTDNKKRERKKEKQQQQHKLKKSNSLEELISTSKIAMDESDTAATTESHVLMRHKGKNGNQRNTSASNVDINKHCEGGTHKEKIQQLTMPKSAAITDTVNKTNERRSWGTDELHYFGDGNGAGTTTVAATDEKNKERKGKKDKEKHVEEEMEIDMDMDNKDEVPEIVNPILNNAGSPTKDINSIAAQQLQSYNNSIINSNKNSNANKKEDKEKLDKVEKRKKCDNNNSNNLQSQEITPSNVEHVTLVSETAEFHVVTKKKKPKKKNSSNENLITNNNNNNTTTNNINNNNYNNNNSNINNNNNNNSTSFTSVATTITTTTTGTTTSPITTHNSIGVTMKNNNNNNKQNKNKNINNNNNNNNNNINNNNSNINNLPPTNKMICNNLHKNTNLINANQTRYQQRTHDGNTTITSSNNTSNTSNDEDVNDEQNGQQQQKQLPDNKKNIDKNVINNKQQTKNSQTTQQQHEIENDIVENADIQQPQSYQKNMQNKHNKQQQHQQFAHKNHTDNKDGKKQNNNKDKKSRRKSTSSMPVSDLSDSSDLDSVHSLPTNNNINNKQAANVAKNKQQQQQHQQRLSQTAHTATNVNSLTTTSTSTNIPKAQISYADIARTHKTPTTTATTQQQQQVSNDKLNIIDSNNILSESNGEGVITTTATTSANNQIKAKTNKKTVHKIDFPELVAINSTNNNSPPQQQQQQSDGTTNVVSYSKRLTANQGLTEVVDANVDDVVEINHDVNNKLEQTTISSNHNNNNVRITKAKSVEHEIIYNDMDQQYPSLEMSVKRHSSAHIGHHQLPQQHQLQSATQINFAAAAKQNVATTRLLNKTNTAESVMMTLNDNNDVQMSRKTNRKERPATTDMQKSPAQTQSEVDNNNKNSRPAVIILNDERNKSVDSEFTFGDFDEEELKFFDEEMLEEQGQQNEHDEEHDANNMESHSMPQLTRLEYVARVKCCHCYPVRPQQLETCNDIETVIIAAARAAAAEKERDQHKLQDESMLSYDDEYEKSNMIEYSSFASVVSSHKHQHQIQNQNQQQYQSHEQHIPDCEMMRQGNKRLKAGNDALSEPIAINIGDTDIDIYYQPPKNSNNGNSSSNNNEHIVEFISNAWREILSSNSAVIYDEQ